MEQVRTRGFRGMEHRPAESSRGDSLADGAEGVGVTEAAPRARRKTAAKSAASIGRR